MKKEFNFINYVTNHKDSIKQNIAKSLLLEAKRKKKDKEKEEEPDDFDTSSFEKEPEQGDLKSNAGNSFQSKTQKLLQLIAKKDDLLTQFKDKKITIDQYKQMIGSIPQEIISLRKDLESMTSVEDENGDVVESTESVNPATKPQMPGKQAAPQIDPATGMGMSEPEPEEPAQPTEQEYIEYLEKRVKDLEKIVKDHMPTSDTYTPEDDRYAGTGISTNESGVPM